MKSAVASTTVALPDGRLVQTTQARQRVRQDGHTWRTKRRARGICRDCPRRLNQWADRCDRCQAGERIRRLRADRLARGTKRSCYLIRTTKPKPVLLVPSKRTAKDPLFKRDRIQRYIRKIGQ